MSVTHHTRVKLAEIDESSQGQTMEKVHHKEKTFEFMAAVGLLEGNSKHIICLYNTDEPMYCI